MVINSIFIIHSMKYLNQVNNLSKVFMMIFAIFATAPLAQSEEVDLELVLAMDASGSVSEKEYLLQLNGTAAAFRDLEIIEAIQAGPTGRIAVALMLWSDAAFPKEKSPWFILKDQNSISQFASFVERFQISENNAVSLGSGGGTGIGSGVQAALNMIASNGYDGLRKVIDVSGDGIETEFDFSKGIMIRDAKLLAGLQNVTINGLPILGGDSPNLDAYYQTEVISGPGAFIVVAEDFDDFGRAIRQKLLREIRSNVADIPNPIDKRFAENKLGHR